VESTSAGARVEGFPVARLDDIIARKQAADRERDRQSLLRLLRFRAWLNARRDRK
jgi:hypothetical protein